MNILNTLNSKQNKLVSYKTYKKDTTIFKEDDFCSSLAIVIDGIIKIASFLDNGDEIIYNIINKDGIFGNNLVFLDKPYYKGDVICLKDCKIAFIQKDELVKILKNNDTFLLEYLKLEANTVIDLNMSIKLLNIDTAKERFYYYLSENNNEITYSSISDLANKLYLTRETLSRLINRLIKQNKLIRNKKTIRLL